MSPERQRIAIAESCGWTVINETLCNVKPDKNGDPEIEPMWPLPDYISDLNAMHEAEEVLDKKNLMMEFANQLVGIVCAARGFRWDNLTTDDHIMLLAHATAAQRAEAFLKTIGKWEDAE